MEAPSGEVNEYIDNLQRAFDSDILQDEVKQINAVVTAGKLHHYFIKKKRVLSLLPPAGILIIIRPYWEAMS